MFIAVNNRKCSRFLRHPLAKTSIDIRANIIRLLAKMGPRGILLEDHIP